MKRKAERLRVVLAVGTVGLLLVLVGTMGYARYRAGKAWLRKAKDRAGVSLVRETDGFTYSQSVQGKTLFTLHAAKAFQHVDGQWTLHDVVLTLYGLRTDRADRVYGNEFEWDETKGIARAVGPVQMDLQVPPGVANAERRGGASAAASQAGDADSVHVQTSGLVFVRQLGVAATQEMIEFRYGGMKCVARGAEFDSSPSALHLLADVHAEGELRGEAVDLRAASADFRRDTNVLTLAQVAMQDTGAQGRSFRGKLAVLQLRPDGSVERASVTGDVVLADAVRKQTVTAARMDAALNDKNKPETAKLSGGVRLVGDDPKMSMQGEAKVVEVNFDGKSQPSRVVAAGEAHFASEGGTGGGCVSRDLRGDRIAAMFAAGANGKAVLMDVLVDGSARAGSVAMAAAAGLPAKGAGTTVNSLAADHLRAAVVQSGAKSSVETVFGQGHVLLRQLAGGGVERTSVADGIEVHLVPKVAGGSAGDVISFAREDGHVLLTTREPAKAGAKVRTDSVGRASAEHATYDGTTEVMTLTGTAHLEDAGRSVNANTVTVEQRTGDASAAGSVVATLAGNVATHIAAGRAVLHKASGLAEFYGGKDGKAKLWQGASQVEAAMITADRAGRTLTAKPEPGETVDSVFAQTPVKAAKEADGATILGPKVKGAGYALHVKSRGLVFVDAEHRAVFDGPVTVDGATGKVFGDKAEAFFGAAPAKAAGDAANGGVNFGASVLDHVVVGGNVRLEEGGRTGSGQQLSYKAADGSFTLTGKPAQMHDAQQGTVTGASLLFRAGDSTIVVAGASTGTPAAASKDGGRAHIETRLRQKAQ